MEVLRKISAGVRLLNVPSESATTAYLCNLLSVRLSASSAEELEQKSPDQIREGTLENLLNLIEHIGRRTKLLLVLEDLHWADDLSFELLALLLDSLPSSAVFIVCLFRPESGHRTAQLSMIARRKGFDRCTEIQLHRLGSEETQRLVEHLLGGAQPSKRAVEHIVAKSEGVPFFAEEIIRSLIEESAIAIRAGSWELDGSASEVDVPDSIQNVISARLGLLSAEDRAFLRYAAVVGRFFKLRLVAHHSGNSGGLEERIRVCSERDLIYAERTVPEAEYAFCHAFTQEATYEEIPEETRIQFHRQVATDIERLYEDRIEEWYETLAFHYSRGDDVDGAIDFLIKAGQKAIRRTDSQAAIALLRRGLEFVERMEDTEQKQTERKPWKPWVKTGIVGAVLFPFLFVSLGILELVLPEPSPLERVLDMALTIVVSPFLHFSGLSGSSSAAYAHLSRYLLGLVLYLAALGFGIGAGICRLGRAREETKEEDSAGGGPT